MEKFKIRGSCGLTGVQPTVSLNGVAVGIKIDILPTAVKMELIMPN